MHVPVTFFSLLSVDVWKQQLGLTETRETFADTSPSQTNGILLPDFFLFLSLKQQGEDVFDLTDYILKNIPFVALCMCLVKDCPGSSPVSWCVLEFKKSSACWFP